VCGSGISWAYASLHIAPDSPADATASKKTHHLLPQLNPDWFYLSGSGLRRFSWKKATNRV